jgi:hypothetical protein
MKPRLLAALLLATIVVACFDAPLGDPKTSTVDPRLDGVWFGDAQNDGKEQPTWLVAPFDEHSYCLVASSYNLRVSRVARTNADPSVWRVWLTPIAGSTFVTIEPIAHLLPASTVKHGYMHAELTFGADGTLTFRALNSEFKHITEITDRKELADFIAANIENPGLFLEAVSLHRRRQDNNAERKIEKALLDGN